jgi:hypothetical protein
VFDFEGEFLPDPFLNQKTRPAHFDRRGSSAAHWWGKCLNKLLRQKKII